MPRPKNPVPSFRLHKQSGQAIVTITVNGKRKDYLLGPYRSKASKVEYQRRLDEHGCGKLEAEDLVKAPPPPDLTVNELCDKFWTHAEKHYRDTDGNTTSELPDLRYAIRVFRELLGDTQARLFGPVAFKRLRDSMQRKGWARTTVNKMCGRVKRIIRFAVENELVPGDRWEALRAVRGLEAGRCDAPEPEPVVAVKETRVREAMLHVTAPVRGMLELQLLTGMRPGELCRIRPAEIDKSGEVWVYRPAKHKTRWRGKVRDVPLGAKAQEILAKFEPTDPQAFYFDPRRAVEQQMAFRAAKRETKLYPSHAKRNAAKRKRRPTRPPCGHYTPHSYAVAVARACDRLHPLPDHLAQQKDEGRLVWWKRLSTEERLAVRKWRKEHRWHPNQVRHTYATTIRKGFGLEAAQVLLGHSKADVTQLYAERNLDLALKVAAQVG